MSTTPVPDAPIQFAEFFGRATRSVTDSPLTVPHPWQAELAQDAACANRLIRIPTGFGKTAGVILAWLFHRVARRDLAWPTRLVFTLPMRTLVEQTEGEVRNWLANLGLGTEVGVHVIMGGAEAGQFHLAPERPSILIGTQDMLVSRALNRGYGARRARWPIDFGLLQQDVLWVFDEIQLMDVALATSAQLAGFREHENAKHLRPVFSWWMSATLQPAWLRTVDWREQVSALADARIRIPPNIRSGGLWDVRKQLSRAPASTTPEEVADLALGAVAGHPGKLVLVIVNTVDRAIATLTALEKKTSETTKVKAKVAVRKPGAPELRIVHSRFRGAERAVWGRAFLGRRAPIPAEGRILVATQVVEAGVDISAAAMVTDLAPWSSLVQRFGRAARYPGETASITVVGAPPSDAKKARPYTLAELATSAQALDRLAAFCADRNVASDAGPATLEAFEDDLTASDSGFLASLYPYRPEHILRRRDLDDLFDTTTDLSGADLDISRWIRSGDERDIQVFWRPVEGTPTELESEDVGQIGRFELCPAPLGAARDWLDDLTKREGAERCYGYLLDYATDTWQRIERAARLVPGMTVLVPSRAGGYGALGFSPSLKVAVAPARAPAKPADGNDRLEESSGGADNDDLSMVTGPVWQTIARHGREVGHQASGLASELGLSGELTGLLGLAGRWHDVGKSHDAFQAKIKRTAREAQGGIALGHEIAKAPEQAWKRGRHASPRPGFRHELASLLALFELVRRTDPWHPWLLGEVKDLLVALGQDADLPTESERVVDHPLALELLELDAHALDLVAYLVLSHHGKLRTSIAASARDQDQANAPIAGVVDGDLLAPTHVAGKAGEDVILPALNLSLAPSAMGLGTRFGVSWAERAAGLVARYGPFALAYLEALIRAADVRASMAADRVQSAGGAS